MHKCNNPKCGYEINWKGRYKICPKCGFVMHPLQKKEKSAVFASKKSKLMEMDEDEEVYKNSEN